MPERDQIIVLADVSPSMAEKDNGREGRTRFDLLKQALTSIPEGVRIITFSGGTRELRSAAEVRMGDDMGGTALHLAIEAAARYSPVRTVIVCDGEPDSEDQARRAVEKLTGIIDVVYCGSPSNVQARGFLESLARAGAGGFYQTGDQVDVGKQLPAVIAGLLGTGERP